MKVAIVHDYLMQYGGAERTLEAICELFPEAPIYTSYYDKNKMSDAINSKTIYSLNNNFLQKYNKYFTFLLPIYFESLNLDEYDLIISDSSSYCKGIITKPHQTHICYIHTTPRFMYKYSTESTKRDAWYFKPFVSYIDHKLRLWDYVAAQRPDYLIANSETVKNRIEKFYNRPSNVIYPPIDINKPKSSSPNMDKPYYFTIGRLVSFKNMDLAVKAFNMTGHKYVIAGEGPEYKYLKQLAGPNVEIVGRVSEKEKDKYLTNCKGFIVTADHEDLGISVMEALSYKKPVLAHKSGGPTETIEEGIDGMFFEELKLESLVEAVKKFDENIENNIYKENMIGARLDKLNDKPQFKKKLNKFIKEKMKNA
jgi:glycosyltransferase involved in cell wall biosynthesis